MKLSKEEKEQKKKEKQLKLRKERALEETNDFMESVRRFLAVKYGGTVPSELECSLKLLRSYYNLFSQMDMEISDLDKLTSNSRYGEVINPLIAAQNAIAVRLENAMKVCGLTLKEQRLMDVADIKQEESPLEQFIKNTTSK